MLRLALVFLLIVSCVGSSAFLFAKAPSCNSQPQADQNPLSLDQLKKLISVRTNNPRNALTKDRAIASAITRRGVTFDISDSVIASLRILGAGSATLRALEKTARRASDSDPSQLTKILVADFEGPKLEGSSVTQVILDELNDGVREYHDIEVAALGEAVSAQQGRRWVAQRAKSLNANIVIWGWYTKNEREVLLNIHFQIMDDVLGPILQSEKQSTILPVSDLFKFQIRLGKEMGYLTFFTVGAARLLAGDLANARKLLTAAIERSNAPDQMIKAGDAYVLRAAIVTLQAGMGVATVPEEFYQDVAHAIRLDDGNIPAYSLRCGAYLISNKVDLALDDCNKAVKLDPNVPGSYFARSWVFRHMNNLTAAISDLERAVQLAQQIGSDHLVLSYQAALHGLKNNPGDAIVAYSELLKDELYPHERYYYLLLRGAAYHTQERYDLAKRDYEDALDVVPKSGIVYWVLGDLAYDTDKYSLAVSHYLKAITIGVTAPEIYVDLGDAYLRQGEPSNAINNYSKAINLDSALADAYEKRGIALISGGKVQEAIQDFTRAISLDPTNGDAFHYRGDCYFLKKEFQAAISDFGKAIELIGQPAGIYYSRGRAYQAQGIFDLALQDFSSAIAIDGRFESAYYSRGLVHSLMGNNEPAIEDFSQAILIRPDYSAAYLGRAKCLLKQSKTADAVSDLNKVLQLTSNVELRKEAERLLSSLTVR